MTTQKLYTQNNYDTELTSAVTLSSGDIEVQVKVAPTYTRGFIFIGPASNPEEAYFHHRVGSTLYIAGPNRKNAATHPVDDPVTISNSAAMINRLEDNSVTTHSPEIRGMLLLRIWGGSYTLSGQVYESENTDLVIADNTTTYVYFCFATRTVKQGYILANITDNTHAEYGEVLCTVTSAGGQITSVVQGRPKMYVSYNDINLGGVNEETPTLTNSYIATLDTDTIDVGATMAIKNSVDSVDKEVSIEAIFDHAQAQGYIDPGAVGYTHTQSSAAATWTITHNMNTADVSFTCYDATTPNNILIPDTVTKNTNSMVLTFGGHAYAGKCTIMAPVGANSVGDKSFDFIAGEDLGLAKMVRMGIASRESGINASYIPSPATTIFDTASSSKSLYQTFKAQRATITMVQLYAKKSNAPDTTALTVEIYATTTQVISGHTYNVPTGTALGTATIAHGSLSTTAAWVAGTLASAITTAIPGSYYAIKIVGVGAQNVLIGQGDDGVNYLTNGFQFISSLTPIVGDYAFKVQHADVASEVPARVYLASAFESATGVITGATKSTAVAGNTVRVETHIATAFSSLTEGVPQFLSDIAGEISPAPGTNSISAGLPISTTSLIIR